MIHPKRLSPLSRASVVLAAMLAHWGGALWGGASAQAAEDACQPRDGLSTCFVADNLWPHAGTSRWASQAPTETTAAESLAVSFFNAYLHQPVGLRVPSPDPEGTTVYAVEHLLSSSLAMALGVTEDLQVSLVLPFALFQQGAGKADVLGSEDRLPRSALGDLRFGATLAWLERDEGAPGPGLSTRFGMTLPTGQDEGFLSSPSAVYAPGASFDYRLGDLTLGADLGLRLRRPVDFANIQIGSQLTASLGASYDLLSDGWLSVNLEAFSLVTLASQLAVVRATDGSTTTEESGPIHAPAEWLLTAQTAGLLDGRFRASLGGGSFIPTSDSFAVTTPAFRVMTALHFVPQEP